jgi:hypothetical protein
MVSGYAPSKRPGHSCTPGRQRKPMTSREPRYLRLTVRRSSVERRRTPIHAVRLLLPRAVTYLLISPASTCSLNLARSPQAREFYTRCGPFRPALFEATPIGVMPSAARPESPRRQLQAARSSPLAAWTYITGPDRYQGAIDHSSRVWCDGVGEQPRKLNRRRFVKI